MARATVLDRLVLPVTSPDIQADTSSAPPPEAEGPHGEPDWEAITRELRRGTRQLRSQFLSSRVFREVPRRYRSRLAELRRRGLTLSGAEEKELRKLEIWLTRRRLQRGVESKQSEGAIPDALRRLAELATVDGRYLKAVRPLFREYVRLLNQYRVNSIPWGEPWAARDEWAANPRLSIPPIIVDKFGSELASTQWGRPPARNSPETELVQAVRVRLGRAMSLRRARNAVPRSAAGSFHILLEWPTLDRTLTLGPDAEEVEALRVYIRRQSASDFQALLERYATIILTRVHLYGVTPQARTLVLRKMNARRTARRLAAYFMRFEPSKKYRRNRSRIGRSSE